MKRRAFLSTLSPAQLPVPLAGHAQLTTDKQRMIDRVTAPLRRWNIPEPAGDSGR
jgi:hypothetical protein